MKGKVVYIEGSPGWLGIAFLTNVYFTNQLELEFRGLQIDSEVIFETNKKTGEAEIINPPKIRGCRVERSLNFQLISLYFPTSHY